jgi:hypothetical protein
MTSLLIAILIALGCYVNEGTTVEEIKVTNPAEYEKAVYIMETGSYEERETGVVIIENVGD